MPGCGGGGGGGAPAEVPGPPDPPPEPEPGNQPPEISGTPTAGVVVDTVYLFIPDASDPDGDPLRFSASGLPPWASFDEHSGKLTGLPSEDDLGNHADIIISVSDGEESTSLPPFAIDVVASASGSLSVTWTAPTLNEDGTPLSDLAGYRVRWGTHPGNYPNTLDIANPGINRFLIENLVPANYYLVIAAFDESDNESALSNEAFGVVE
jgi:hypothetical protein